MHLMNLIEAEFVKRLSLNLPLKSFTMHSQVDVSTRKFNQMKPERAVNLELELINLVRIGRNKLKEMT